MIRKRLSTVVLLLVFLTGLSLLLYPTVSDLLNTMHGSYAIAGYTQTVAALDNDKYADLLQQAADYNDRLYRAKHNLALTDSERAEYEQLLNVGGDGIMGYVEIAKINCFLPIYHGTDESVLQVGVGHIEGSSLPVGGANTHCVLSGHRGLPSAKLFSNLNELEVGDRFVLRILDETLTYEVDQIRIVLPSEVNDLIAEEGQDLCTLVTCTPYGVNTHRLLVRGHRVENEAAARQVRVTADALQIEPVVVAPVVAVPLLLVVLAFLLSKPKKRKRS